MKSLDSIGRLLLFALAAIIIIAPFHVMRPVFISRGLDPSWIAALVEARHLNLRFGQDVIFTMGPLASVYDGGFAPSLFYGELLVVLMITFYLSAFITVVSTQRRNIAACCFAVAPCLFIILRDSVFMSVPLCAALLATISNGGIRCRSLVIAGAIVAAAATMAKFSMFPVAVAGFLIIDILAVTQRRIPLSLAIYFTGLAAILWWTSPGASLWLFIKHSLDVAFGYTEAMSASGSLLEVILVGITMCALIAIVGTTEFKKLRIGEASPMQAGARFIIIALFLFICAKAGLIRHDGHAMIAWSGAALAAGFYCALSWDALARRKVGGLALIILVCAVWTYKWAGRHSGLTPGLWAARLVADPFRELALLPSFIEDPAQWIKDQETIQQEAMARLRAQQPLPTLDGTVDVIPSIQSSVIANGLKYWPRPVFQEYLSCSRPLIEANRAFFRSARAPDYLLMAADTIDGRYPAQSEGPLWPEFLARYSVQDIVGGLSVLHRRDKPIEVPLHTFEKKVATLGEPVTVDPAPGPIFATIDIRPTLAGSLAKLIFKTAQVYMDIQYTDGSQSRYRIIPGIAREGFFLSPTIDSAEGYAALATGLAGSIPSQVRSFSIAEGALGRWLWASHYTVTLSRLDDATLREANGSNSLSASLQNKLQLMHILKENPPGGPALRMVPEGLLAHAPKQLKIATGGHTALDISFGMQAGAWQGAGETKGVCFSVVSKAATAPLWQRCLDPKNQAADRGAQNASVTIPSGVNDVLLETVCRDGCAWDWSYWGKVSFH